MIRVPNSAGPAARLSAVWVPGMSLATTAAQLEDVWQQQTRHNPPTDRWAREHPALAGSLDDIRARLADRDRSRSGPTLAALVKLATGGDRDAALLVTLALLPRMVAAETRRAGRAGGYDELASHLWEAVVTATNPHTKCLREYLERNAWRRHRHQQQRPLKRTVWPCPAGWWELEVDPRCQSPLLSSATSSVSRSG